MSIFDKLPQVSEPMRLAVVRAVIYLGVFIALAYWAQDSDLFIDKSPIAVSIEMPDTVTLIKDADSIPLSVLVRIKNNTKEPAKLEVPTTCHIFRWFVTSPEGEFIQAEKNELCTQVVMTANLPAGEKAEETMQIDLDPRRLQPDTEYVLSFRFWGQDGQALFTAVEE